MRVEDGRAHDRQRGEEEVEQRAAQRVVEELSGERRVERKENVGERHAKVLVERVENEQRDAAVGARAVHEQQRLEESGR